jgi:TRAP-type C4-dicarboxylate transport system permease small subunit
MSADALAVLGRHLGLPLLGSIEIVQASVVFIASSAMVAATLKDTHARVHIIIERLSSSRRLVFERAADLVSAVLFLLFAAGSIWVAGELWSGHEVTELLQIPLRWLRLFWIASALLIAVLFAARAVRKREHLQ